MGVVSRKKLDLSTERQVVTGMIISERVIKEIQPLYKPELMQGPHMKIIADWCKEYYDQFEKPPGNHIQDIYNSRQADLKPEESDAIAALLLDLSDEFERSDKINSEYILDRAEKYFKERSFILLSDRLKDAINQGDSEEAERALLDYTVVERPKSKGIDPISDEESVRNAFEVEEDVLFRMPGALGEMIGPIERDSFIGIMGPEKRGKTWWLMEFALRGNRARCNVAFFQVGDMSEPQMVRRIHTYISRRHYRQKYCGRIIVPVLDCYHNQLGSCRKPERSCRAAVISEVTGELRIMGIDEAPSNYKPCTFCKDEGERGWKGAAWLKYEEEVEPLDWRDAYNEGKKWAQRARGKRFKLITYPNDTCSIREIENQLDMWERIDNFIADVVVIDYVDIMKSLISSDFRHQENKKWQALRSLSQKRHCCVITATQADAKSYDVRSLKMQHFSEDKRKYGHVTRMLSLNQTPDEKARGIMRIGEIVVREDDFDILREVVVLQCLSKGSPYLTSFFK